MVLVSAVLLRDEESGSGAEMVALGDSYSAGVGLGEVTSRDCDRDPGAYGPRAAAMLGIVDVVLAACSGAVTDNLTRSQEVDAVGPDVVFDPQLDSVSTATDVVAITIGGNDAGFAEKVVTCLIGRCGATLYGVDPSSLEDPSLTWELLEQRLVEAYVDIRSAMSPDGHLFVLSYPIPFEVGDGSRACTGFDVAEMEAANAFATRLGDLIESATAAANERLDDDEDTPGHVVFVDWRVGERVDGGFTSATGDTFDYVNTPHGICSEEPYVNGFDPATLLSGDVTNSFHPTALGYEVAAEALADAIDTR